MTKKSDDKPDTAKRGRPNQFEPSNVEPDQALKMLCEMPKQERSIAKLAAALKESGTPVSPGTLYKWNKKKDWPARILRYDESAARGEREDVLLRIAEDRDLQASDFGRLALAIVVHAESEMKQIPIKTPDDLEKMVTIAGDLESLVERMRGEVVPPSAEEKTADLGEFGKHAQKHLKVVENKE